VFVGILIEIQCSSFAVYMHFIDNNIISADYSIFTFIIMLIDSFILLIAKLQLYNYR